MSDVMANLKKEEIEQFNKAEEEMKELTKDDRCPVCKTHISDFTYYSVLPPPIGWIECSECGSIFCPNCSECGGIFCPKSIMNFKRQKSQSSLSL